MDTTRDGQAAILIDFENLVRGMGDDESIDCEVLFRLAEEYGRVLVANAYADWRMKDVNQYQTDLYRLGVELVHVFGKGWGAGFKNAVDVKMAVDAISAVSALPHIDVFVIVSGDRDFIHVLKALRRHGKTVIGVSPGSAASDDFAALCDRFVQYEALATAYELPSAAAASTTRLKERPDMTPLRQALKSIITARPEGLKGAMIKPLLRRELSPSFDESTYGYSRLTDLLRDLSDVVRVVAPEGGGDILVFPASSAMSAQVSSETTESRSQRLIRLANLQHYRFEQDVVRRRRILMALFDAMKKQPFSWDDVQRHVLAKMSGSDTPLSVTILSRYRSMIYHSRGFKFEPNHEDRPQRERSMRLRGGVDSGEDLVRLYEGTVAYKIMDAADEDVSASTLADVLHLPSDDEATLDS
ncbi:MAG TPA: NYN domain-containing protein [Nitrospiraceae bacterium]|jgi:uncharacterized protein (TIGR00288 family)